MRKDDLYTLKFAAIICVTCSLLLAGASALLRGRQAMNAELDRQVNILKTLGISILDRNDRKLPRHEIRELFDNNINGMVFDVTNNTFLTDMTVNDIPKAELKSGAKLPLYLWQQDRKNRYAFPIEGKGLWGPIHGYMAVEDDMNTIAGVTFITEKETPGLGKEIENDAYEQKFKNKKIMRNGKLARFTIAKGQLMVQDNPHAVDGISGATLTGKGVEEMINRTLATYKLCFEKLK